MPAIGLESVTWMLVVFTVPGAAAEENVIWMVALAETCVVPEAGVIEATEKAAGEIGLTGGFWLPAPQPVRDARHKAIEETQKPKRNLVRSMINATLCRLGGMVGNPSPAGEAE